MVENSLFLVSSKDNRSLRVTEEWLKAAVGSRFCPACWRILPGVFPERIDVHLDVNAGDEPKGPVYLLSPRSAITVVRDDMIAAMGPLPPSVVLGSVLVGGKSCSTFRTMYASHSTWIDSVPDGTNIPLPCKCCHQPFPSGQRWTPAFLRAALGASEWIFPRTGFGLYVTDTMVTRRDLKKIPGIALLRCAVL